MRGAIGPTFSALFSFARHTLHGEGVFCVTRSSGVCAGKQRPTQPEAAMGINLHAGIIDGIPLVFPTGGSNGGRLKVTVCVGAFNGGCLWNWTS